MQGARCHVQSARCGCPEDVARCLEARDARGALVDEARRLARLRGARAIAWISSNVPGPDKLLPGLDRVFRGAVTAALEYLPAEGLDIEGVDVLGPYAALALACDPADAKRRAVALEEAHRARRLIDIDVYEANGAAWDRARLGLPQRACLVCDEPARECIRLRRHAPAELAAAAAALLAHERAADALARCLLDGARLELDLTPKPGLVDRRDNGSHPDLTYLKMAESIALLPVYFGELLALGRAGAGLAPCIEAGRRAEHRMFDAIGANAHRGYIFLGGLLLLAACAVERGETRDDAGPAAVTNHATLRAHVRSIAHEFFARGPAPRDGMAPAGRVETRRDGAGGIRAEALAGLPGVFEIGLPVFETALHATGDRLAASYALLGALMQQVEDTTAINRCGPDGLARLKRDGAEVARLVSSGASPVPFLESLNDEYRRARLTMGGVADCMAAVFALHQLSAATSAGAAI